MPEEWYSNKELFEQILALRSEMSETRTLIKQYNGLREIVDVVKDKVEDMEAHTKGRNSTLEAIRLWGGWVVAIIALISSFI